MDAYLNIKQTEDLKCNGKIQERNYNENTYIEMKKIEHYNEETNEYVYIFC